MFKGLRYRNLVTFGAPAVIFAVCLSCFGLNQQGSKRARTNRKTNTGLASSYSVSLFGQVAARDA